MIINSVKTMSDFLNMIPPSLREAMEFQNMPEMSEEYKARIMDLLGRERPESEEPIKTSRCKENSK